jgi:hypothetical protein
MRVKVESTDENQPGLDPTKTPTHAMPKAKPALALPGALIVRYFREGDIERVK